MMMMLCDFETRRCIDFLLCARRRGFLLKNEKRTNTRFYLYFLFVLSSLNAIVAFFRVRTHDAYTLHDTHFHDRRW